MKIQNIKHGLLKLFLFILTKRKIEAAIATHIFTSITTSEDDVYTTIECQTPRKISDLYYFPKLACKLIPKFNGLNNTLHGKICPTDKIYSFHFVEREFNNFQLPNLDSVEIKDTEADPSKKMRIVYIASKKEVVLEDCGNSTKLQG